MSLDAETPSRIGIYYSTRSFRDRYHRWYLGVLVFKEDPMRLILAIALLLAMNSTGEARIFGRKHSTTNHSSSGVDTSCAQGVAEGMARRNWVGHFGLGGTGLYEGCASGPTKQYAYDHCCFANDRSLKTVDVGYAQSSSGRWYCCRRYCR